MLALATRVAALATLCVALLPDGLAALQPTVTLGNAARSGVTMPLMGIGTGGYGRYYHNDSEVTEGTA